MRALEERRYADARAAFLQAVSADPSFAGAWLDLAIAAQAEGDTVSAEEFLAILEARFVLPGTIAQGVRALRERMARQQQDAAPAQWRRRGSAQAGLGYDSNANAGLALGDLTLTLPGGAVALPLAAAQQPRSDAYALAGLALEGARRLGAGQLELSASAKTRINTQLGDFDTLELQAGAGYSSNEPAFDGALGGWLPGPWRVGVNAQQLRLGGSPLLSSLALAATHAWAGVACAPQGGVEIDFRHFPSQRNLDSTIAWFSASAACPSPVHGTGARLGFQLRAGLEQARGDFLSTRGRPGGDTRHLELTMSHQWNWAGPRGTHKLEALLQWARARDTEGYSPWLADNARRKLVRASAGLAYTLPLQAAGSDETGWTATVALQGFRQRSTLELFRLKGEVLQLSVQKPW